MDIYSGAPSIPIIALSQCWSKSRLALPQKFLTWQNQNRMIKPAYHQLCWRSRILNSNFHDCFKPFEQDRQFLIMYGQPTITKGQEKSEVGNSPNHPGSIFKFSCLIRFSTRRCLYSQRELCICRQCVSNGKIWMEFIVLSHHQIYILTSSLLGQTKNEKPPKWFCLSGFDGNFVANLARQGHLCKYNCWQWEIHIELLQTQVKFQAVLWRQVNAWVHVMNLSHIVLLFFKLDVVLLSLCHCLICNPTR